MQAPSPSLSLLFKKMLPYGAPRAVTPPPHHPALTQWRGPPAHLHTIGVSAVNDMSGTQQQQVACPRERCTITVAGPPATSTVLWKWDPHHQPPPSLHASASLRCLTPPPVLSRHPLPCGTITLQGSSSAPQGVFVRPPIARQHHPPAPGPQGSNVRRAAVEVGPVGRRVRQPYIQKVENRLYRVHSRTPPPPHAPYDNNRTVKATHKGRGGRLVRVHSIEADEEDTGNCVPVPTSLPPRPSRSSTPTRFFDGGVLVRGSPIGLKGERRSVSESIEAEETGDDEMEVRVPWRRHLWYGGNREGPAASRAPVEPGTTKAWEPRVTEIIMPMQVWLGDSSAAQGRRLFYPIAASAPQVAFPRADNISHMEQIAESKPRVSDKPESRLRDWCRDASRHESAADEPLSPWEADWSCDSWTHQREREGERDSSVGAGSPLPPPRYNLTPFSSMRDIRPSPRREKGADQRQQGRVARQARVKHHHQVGEPAPPRPPFVYTRLDTKRNPTPPRTSSNSRPSTPSCPSVSISPSVAYRPVSRASIEREIDNFYHHMVRPGMTKGLDTPGCLCAYLLPARVCVSVLTCVLGS